MREEKANKANRRTDFSKSKRIKKIFNKLAGCPDERVCDEYAGRSPKATEDSLRRTAWRGNHEQLYQTFRKGEGQYRRERVWCLSSVYGGEDETAQRTLSAGYVRLGYPFSFLFFF